ncbi:Centromere protein X [Colletotrichum truncatum]|uniref:Centromere protein X n=1 Tax=Colletotrichum truncatum TaxID=5467 RepID=A0ACC3ZAV3_COLTU|nr:Centromere protein X [Colletotrichum truncatum]KAF6783164.1 Centromere protein X [Colletotrichum truncatum]
MPKAPAQPAKRGRSSKPTQPAASTKRKTTQQPAKRKSGPFELSDSDVPPQRDEPAEGEEEEVEEEEEAEEGPENTIPPELLTRLLHEFFEKDDTRLSKDANAAAGKYMDVFVREAIARCVHERPGGFLEVEDLEKIAPQLLMDF